MMTLEEVRNYAAKCHADTNHKYGDEEYVVHLDMAYQVALLFIYLIPVNMREIVLRAIFCHDLIEDARVTYNDLVKKIGRESADIVFALTNEKGKTRKDRANAKYYREIRETEFADFAKLCDRIANVQNGKLKVHSMVNRYEQELPQFKKELISDRTKEMFIYLEELIFS